MTFIDPELFGVGEVAAELYDALYPAMVDEDPEAPTPDDLLAFCDTLGSQLEDWWLIVQENWETVLDPDLTPEVALDYLGQFVGVARRPGWSGADFRDAIKSPAGFDRGSPGAIQAATARTLTGTQTVLMIEREPDAYNLFIRTLMSETPDEDVTRAAILTQKPAGILLDYEALAAQDYATVDAAYADYDALDAAYDSYDEMASDLAL